jgi:hypothetical protein
MNTQFAGVKFRTKGCGNLTRDSLYKILSSGRVEVRCTRAEDENGYELPNARHCEWTSAENVVEACKVFVELALDCADFGRPQDETIIFVWGRTSEFWQIREREMSAHELASLARQRAA